jgi:hypothetical protein
MLEVHVGIVRSQNSAPYLDATQALVNSLARQSATHHPVEVWSPAELAALPVASLSGVKVWVALGTEAATALARVQLKAPVLHALLPRSSFERVLRACITSYETLPEDVEGLIWELRTAIGER